MLTVNILQRRVMMGFGNVSAYRGRGRPGAILFQGSIISSCDRERIFFRGLLHKLYI